MLLYIFGLISKERFPSLSLNCEIWAQIPGKVDRGHICLDALISKFVMDLGPAPLPVPDALQLPTSGGGNENSFFLII